VLRRAGGQLVAAPTRAQIMDGCYDAERLAVAWTDDPVALYYAQIQGGALLDYPDGRRRTLIYAGNNGYGYVSIEPDVLKYVPESERPGGYPGLRRWLHAHPREAASYFRGNPRYIFFRVSDEPPVGMARLPLTAKRSIATDKAFYSAGLMALVEYPEPTRQADGSAVTRTVQYLAADADTGAAIKGPARVDVYFGEGSFEELFAAGLKNNGTLAYLLARQ
jgi:membrane-bound lytic murein transglycosylase A